MARDYKHIEQYEKEILELREQGFTRKEIGEKLNLSKEQIKNFIGRYNRKQKKLDAGIAIHKKGRPAKNCTVTNEDKVSELRYLLARKDAKIRQLEMENDLMRDFLMLTERK